MYSFEIVSTSLATWMKMGRGQVRELRGYVGLGVRRFEMRGQRLRRDPGYRWHL